MSDADHKLHHVGLRHVANVVPFPAVTQHGMSASALNDLREITDRMTPGMWLKLDRAAFLRYFGYGEDDCIVLVEQNGDEWTAEIMRSEATGHRRAARFFAYSLLGG